jgi:hypothetical protein
MRLLQRGISLEFRLEQARGTLSKRIAPSEGGTPTGAGFNFEHFFVGPPFFSG